MKYSYNWLKEVVDHPGDVHTLTQELTMAGMKLEGTEEISGDTVLDFEIPVNRPDCLSIYGLAREISALFGTPIHKQPDFDARKVHRVEAREGRENKKKIKIEIEEHELCARYCGQIVEGIRVAESPEWIRKKLEGCGVRGINNVVDVTNLVMLELGQPLHAFDYDKLAEGTIRVRKARGEKLLMIDGKERLLIPDMLVIADAVKAQAVAGVMGGKESEVTNATTTILLESAYFQPASVRKTAKQLELSTDASYRFERGVDHAGQARACERAATLLQQIAGSTPHTVLDVAPVRFPDKQIPLRQSRIRRILGTEIDPAFVKQTLLALGFEPMAGDLWKPPTYRVDIFREIDLIEEIARMYGYNRFADTLPAAEKRYQPDYPTYNLECSFSDFLKAARVDEACTYSFQEPSESTTEKRIRIKNPISETASELRTSLLPDLFQSIEYNLHHRNEDVRLFEIGHVFFEAGEETALAIALIGEYPEIKGIVEGALEALQYERPNIIDGKISVQNESIGTINSTEIEGHLVQGCEIYLTDLIRVPRKELKYKPIIPYPFIERDASLILSETIPYSDLEKLIKGLHIEELRSYKLVDRYKGPNTPPGKISLTFRFLFQSENRTLTSEEVDRLYARIVDEFTKRFDAELRK
jgi:phenylalanyl-tRNA synthetase beta chain